MMDWISTIILLVVGLIAGTINVIAGGGSFLTLPVLIFLGLPPIVANGTNRVGILVQNIGAVWGFHQSRVLNWKWAFWVAIPAIIGAGLGTWIALVIGDENFRKILAFLMVVISLWTFIQPKLNQTPSIKEMSFKSFMGLFLGFFLVGIYGGFVQAGVGFLILAVTSMVGYDLVRGNAIKVFCILGFTLLSLAIFTLSEKVHWSSGLLLGAGTFVGGQIGVRLTTLKGHYWVKRVVTVTIILFAIKLWFMG